MRQKAPHAITAEDAPPPPQAPRAPVQRPDPIRGFGMINDTPFAQNVKRMFQRVINPRPKTVVHNQRGASEWPVKVMDGDWSAQTMPEPRNPAGDYAPNQRGVGLGAGPGTAPNTWFDNLTERIFGSKGFDPQRNPTTTPWGDNAGSMMNVGGVVPPLNPSGPSKRKIVADAPPPVAFGSTPLHQTWTAPMGPIGKDASTSWANKQDAATYVQDAWTNQVGNFWQPDQGKDASTSWANKQDAATYVQDAWTDQVSNFWQPDQGKDAKRAPSGAGQEVPALAPFATGNTNGPLREGTWEGGRQRDAPHFEVRGMDARPHGMMDTLPQTLPDATAVSHRDTEPMEIGSAAFASMPHGMSTMSHEGDDAHKFAHKTVLGAVTYHAGGGVGSVPPDPLAHPKESRNVMVEQPRAETAEMRTTRGDIGVSMTNNQNTWGAPRQSRRVKDEDDEYDKDHTRVKWEMDKARTKRQRAQSF